MNWFDRAIATVAPETGMRRLRARAALRVMQQLDGQAATRAFDGAKRGRRTEGWTARGESATQALLGDLDTLRNRSRDLVRNNPYASKAISTMQRHMVRGGIAPVWDNTAANKVWRAWTKQADFRGQTSFAGLQAQIVRCWDESGEVLVRKRPAPSRLGLVVPLQLEVLEPDYLASWKTQELADGFILAGVEFDRDGRRRAYWLYPSHPGETIPLGRGYTPVRIPADQIIHAYSVVLGRPGQVRGKPLLATSMLRLRDLDEYQEAELVRKKIEACFAVFVTNAGGGAPGIPGVTSALDATTGRRIETLAPGMINYMGTDQDVKFGQPTPSPADGYTRDELHAIAAGAEVTYEQLTGDLSQVNYSSIRAGRQEFFALIDQRQQLEFIPQICDPIAIDVMRIAFIAGAVRARDLTPTDWTCPRPEYVDPVKDVQAIKEQIRGGLISQDEGIRMGGYDPAQVRTEQQKANEDMAEKNLSVDTDARVKKPSKPAEPDAGEAKDSTE